MFIEDILAFSRCDRLVALLLKRQTIPPDDFLNGALQRVWASQSVRDACPDLKFPTVSR